jgi:nitrogenase molybdenum-iron protein beta chain
MNCETGCKLFGAYRVAISIKDSAVLIHSTIGCNWGTLFFHTPSQLTDIRQSCTVIYEEDLVFGGEKLFKAAMDNALKLYSSKILFVLTGCVPEIMNDDIEGILNSYQNTKPVYLLKSAGFRGDAFLGTADSIDLLISRMTHKAIVKNSINIIGLFSDDFKADADLYNIKTLLSDIVTVNAVIPYDFYDHIMNAPAAALNVVFDGFELVGEKLQKKFGTPYITVKYPYGIKGSREFAYRIASALPIQPKVKQSEQEICTIRQLNKISQHIANLRGMPVAVIGDTVRAAGLENFLQNELGMSVEVAIDTSKSSNKISYSEQVQQSNAILLFGSSFERNIADQLSIPFMQFTYPVFDKICISKSGYTGFEGMLCFVEELLNILFEFNAKGHACSK